LQALGGRLRDDGDDFSSARQLDGDLAIHRSGSDMLHFAFEGIACADVHSLSSSVTMHLNHAVKCIDGLPPMSNIIRVSRPGICVR
jgi:hypothetical protein